MITSTTFKYSKIHCGHGLTLSPISCIAISFILVSLAMDNSYSSHAYPLSVHYYDINNIVDHIWI